jgi:hypothetical protein
MNEIKEMSFIPHDLVTVMVGQHSTNCYPKVEASMPIHERTFAYQVAKSALKSLPVIIRLIIEAMATQLNCNATADGLMYDWKSVLDKGWYNPALLQILSFHNLAGLEIVDTTTIADASILLPVVDGNLANCPKLDVRFVRVQITLDYATLFAAGHTRPTSIKSMYYIELPNTIAPMINGNGIAYNLSTYHGPADIRTMTAAKVLTEIVDPCLQMGPITLKNADFNLAAANIDTSKHRDLLNSKILQLGFKQICDAMFRQLCPSYSDQPRAVIKHIRQPAPGPETQSHLIHQCSPTRYPVWTSHHILYTLTVGSTFHIATSL